MIPELRLSYCQKSDYSVLPKDYYYLNIKGHCKSELIWYFLFVGFGGFITWHFIFIVNFHQGITRLLFSIAKGNFLNNIRYSTSTPYIINNEPTVVVQQPLGIHRLHSPGCILSIGPTTPSLLAFSENFVFLLGSYFISTGDYNTKHQQWSSRVTYSCCSSLNSSLFYRTWHLNTHSPGSPTNWPMDTKSLIVYPTSLTFLS